MDLREIGLGGVNWIRLSQDRDRWRTVVSAVMNLRVLALRSYSELEERMFFYIYLLQQQIAHCVGNNERL
jgi:hypothetical protein